MTPLALLSPAHSSASKFCQRPVFTAATTKRSSIVRSLPWPQFGVEPTEGLLQSAAKQAETYGLAAMDALHVAAALTANASELITTEKPSKPIHRVKGLFDRSLIALIYLDDKLSANLKFLGV